MKLNKVKFSNIIELELFELFISHNVFSFSALCFEFLLINLFVARIRS